MKAASFLQQVQAVAQAALSDGPYESEDLVIRGTGGRKFCCIEFIEFPIGKSELRPLGFWDKTMPSSAEIIHH